MLKRKKGLCEIVVPLGFVLVLWSVTGCEEPISEKPPNLEDRPAASRQQPPAEPPSLEVFLTELGFTELPAGVIDGSERDKYLWYGNWALPLSEPLGKPDYMIKSFKSALVQMLGGASRESVSQEEVDKLAHLFLLRFRDTADIEDPLLVHFWVQLMSFVDEPITKADLERLAGILRSDEPPPEPYKRPSEGEFSVRILEEESFQQFLRVVAANKAPDVEAKLLVQPDRIALGDPLKCIVRFTNKSGENIGSTRWYPTFASFIVRGKDKKIFAMVTREAYSPIEGNPELKPGEAVEREFAVTGYEQSLEPGRYEIIFTLIYSHFAYPTIASNWAEFELLAVE